MRCDSAPGPTTTADGFQYVYQAGNVYTVPGSYSEDRTRVSSYEYRYVPTCSGNGVGADEAGFDALCTAARPVPAGGDPHVALLPARGRRRPLGPRDPRCYGAAVVVTGADLEAAAQQALESRVVSPGFSIDSTARHALVNVPVMVSAPDAAIEGFAVTAPLPGVVTVEERYAWDFGSGVIDDHRRGRPYTAWQSALDDSAGYYTAAAYDGVGPQSVSLTVTWTAELRVAGIAVPFPATVTRTVSEPLVVQEARGRLVRG